MYAPVLAFLVQSGEPTILLSLEKLGTISMTSELPKPDVVKGDQENAREHSSSLPSDL